MMIKVHFHIYTYAQHCSIYLYANFHMLIHGFIKNSIPSWFYVGRFFPIYIVYCPKSGINSSIYFPLVFPPPPQNNLKNYWNKQKVSLLSDQIFQDGWEAAGKCLTNAWFVHCLKATKIFHHCSISKFFPLIVLSIDGILSEMPKSKSRCCVIEQTWVLSWQQFFFFWSLCDPEHNT